SRAPPPRSNAKWLGLALRDQGSARHYLNRLRSNICWNAKAMLLLIILLLSARGSSRKASVLRLTGWGVSSLEHLRLAVTRALAAGSVGILACMSARRARTARSLRPGVSVLIARWQANVHAAK